MPPLAAVLLAIFLGAACEADSDVVAQVIEEDLEERPDQPGGMNPAAGDGDGDAAGDGDGEEPIPGGPDPSGFMGLDAAVPQPGSGRVDMCDIPEALAQLNFPPWWLPVVLQCGGTALTLSLSPSDLEQEEAVYDLLGDPPIPEPSAGSFAEYTCDQGDFFYTIPFTLAGGLCPRVCEWLRASTLLQIGRVCNDALLVIAQQARLDQLLATVDDEDAGMPMP